MIFEFIIFLDIFFLICSCWHSFQGNFTNWLAPQLVWTLETGGHRHFWSVSFSGSINRWVLFPLEGHSGRTHPVSCQWSIGTGQHRMIWPCVLPYIQHALLFCARLLSCSIRCNKICKILSEGFIFFLWKELHACGFVWICVCTEVSFILGSPWGQES